MTIEELRQQAKSLPCLPGVYMMKDYLGNIIYVGKSKELKKRVSSYFRNNLKERDKIKRLVANIDHFDYQITDTEFDALLLECQLIKGLKPIYNTLLKNDKRYRFIVLNINKELPRLEVAFEKEEEGEYFGPYDIPYRLISGVEAINAYYGLPSCKSKMPKKDCLAYLMKKCIGPCEDGQDTSKVYEDKLKAATKFLEGKDLSILSYYSKKMKKASESLAFEKAIEYREYLMVLKMLTLRKEAVQFSLNNKRGMAFIKMPQGGIKFYLFAGTQIIYNQCFENLILPLEQEEKQKIKRQMLIICNEYFKKDFPKRNHLRKEEIDEVLITYYYLKTKKESYYEPFIASKSQKMKERKIDSFTEKALKHFEEN